MAKKKWPRKLLHPLQDWCDNPSCKACKIKWDERMDDWHFGEEFMGSTSDAFPNLDYDARLNAMINAFNAIQNVRRKNEKAENTFVSEGVPT